MTERISISGLSVALYFAWVIALIATLGALFIGEVMGRVPCDLCWFQRAFMFPLSVVLGIASYRSDPEVWRYALPMTFIGALIAASHTLLYFDILPQAIRPCGNGPSCTSSDMLVLAQIPIPVLSLIAFCAIAGLILFVRRRSLS